VRVWMCACVRVKVCFVCACACMRACACVCVRGHVCVVCVRVCVDATKPSQKNRNIRIVSNRVGVFMPEKGIVYEINEI